ncbi:hypothetical protein ACLOJK_018831 [Asimina triloba]
MGPRHLLLFKWRGKLSFSIWDGGFGGFGGSDNNDLGFRSLEEEASCYRGLMGSGHMGGGQCYCWLEKMMEAGGAVDGCYRLLDREGRGGCRWKGEVLLTVRWILVMGRHR